MKQGLNKIDAYVNCTYDLCCEAPRPVCSPNTPGDCVVSIPSEIPCPAAGNDWNGKALTVNTAVCKALHKLDALLTDPLSGCASRSNFYSQTLAYIQLRVGPIGGAVLFLSVLQFFLIIASCVIMCSNSEQFDAGFVPAASKGTAGAEIEMKSAA